MPRGKGLYKLPGPMMDSRRLTGLMKRLIKIRVAKAKRPKRRGEELTGVIWWRKLGKRDWETIARWPQ